MKTRITRGSPLKWTGNVGLRESPLAQKTTLDRSTPLGSVIICMEPPSLHTIQLTDSPMFEYGTPLHIRNVFSFLRSSDQQ